jgi:hypothetical protein
LAEIVVAPTWWRHTTGFPMSRQIELVDQRAKVIDGSVWETEALREYWQRTLEVGRVARRGGERTRVVIE